MHELRSILTVLYNGDSESPAQEVAVDWATRTGASLTGLAIVDETVAQPQAVPVGGGAFKEEQDAALVDQKQQAAEAAKESFVRRCEESNLDFDVEIRSGVPHEVIGAELRRHDVSLIKKEPPTDYGVGESPSDAMARLIKTSSRPVVAVPEGHRGGDTIVVAFDGSPPASRALFALVGSGLPAIGNVTLLAVDEHSEQAARETAQCGLDYLQRHEIETTVQPIASDRSVAEIVCEEAERQRAALIVMGPHARSALVEFFYGSATKEAVERSKVPVFLYH
jgi:nucleotide-binding universal stress UspA family protein